MHHHHPHNTTAGSANSNTTQLPTQRRRKKRPNYGTRTVEVRRGYSGFGFTISGQQPCRLSCIIPNSPADQAGLRAGDCLISVNGLNVSKLPHETVVQLIGNSFGSIRMQIAEHYYSDSTDDENTASCSPAIPSLGPYRPRYVYHKTKQQRMRNSPMKKNESQLPLPRTAQLSKKCPVSTVKKPTVAQLNLKRPLSEELKCTVISPSLTSTSSTVSNVRAMVRAPLISGGLEYKAIVGYLGTIEMPKQISHSSKLQTVRSCIRKLRQEKRAPSTVLMVILPDCLKLLSNTGNTLATYASSRLNYVSSSSESENRFFGLVTSTIYTSPPEEIDDDGEPVAAASHSSAIDHITISNSCHVFVVDTKLCDHSQHVSKAQEFRIECTKDPISNLCLEFPNNSEYVVNLIRSMYTMRIIPPATQRSMSDDPNLHAGGSRNTTAHSPQPSNHSEISTTTSNSDSGIGYNNDCSNITDRIVVVDFPQPTASTRTSHITLNVGQRPHNICQQDMQEDIASTSLAANKRLTVRAMPDPKIPYNLNSPKRCLITSRSCDDVLNLLEQEFENFDDQPALTSLSQQCYASMDDISLYPQLPTKEEHQFIRPLKKMENFRDIQVLSAEDNGKVESADTKNESKTNLRLKFETWNSVHDISCQSREITQSSPDKLISTPDLSKIDVEGSNSPFERGWIQTSLRTPRADKHTLQFSLTPEATKVRSEISAVPTVCRSDFLINSDVDRNSVDYRISTNDLTKHLPKGPSAWSSSIEVLLADPAGIKSFAEFLKQEYAAENIFFWTACERFRNIENASERQEQALIIYTKHLTSGSLEPVNVDSKARSMVEQNLSKADKDLFQPAQKQIFNLMKFDCYQRFLKSELYKQCLQAEKKGKPLPFNGENLDELLKTTNFSESASSKLKKSASNAEEGRRRRSLLPWHRKANHARSKSRDRIAIEKTNNDNTCTKAPNPSAKSLLKASDNIWKQSSSIHGSKSSLASFDALPVSELNCNYCRIKFPDGATTITQLKPDETVAQLVERLFEKRNVKYQFYDVSISVPPFKSVDLQSLAQELSQKEVEIEQRVAFKLDLPTPKVISVKSKPRKQLYEVVRPILQRYNINPEVVDVVMRETQEKVDLSQLVTHIDNQRLQVVLKKTYPPLPQTIQNRKVYNQPKSSIINGLHTAQSTLDEITNKVFSDLMNVKNQNALTKPSKLDQCSLKSDECASESSSYLKRIRNGKKNEEVTGIGQIKLKKISFAAKGATLDCKLAIKEKVKAGVKQQFPLKVTERKEDLLEDLKRAQLARLEDQRGTEINFELPEFLKNTENFNSSSSSNNNNNNGNNSNSLTSSPVEKPPQPAPRLSIINPTKSKPTSPVKLDEEQNFIEDFEDIDSSLRGPPPLPPKPKVLPIKPSNWGVNISHITKTALLPSPSVSNSKPINANISAIPSNNVIISPNVRCAYLDQPSSSFV